MGERAGRQDRDHIPKRQGAKQLPAGHGQDSAHSERQKIDAHADDDAVDRGCCGVEQRVTTCLAGIAVQAMQDLTGSYAGGLYGLALLLERRRFDPADGRSLVAPWTLIRFGSKSNFFV